MSYAGELKACVLTMAREIRDAVSAGGGGTRKAPQQKAPTRRRLPDRDLKDTKIKIDQEAGARLRCLGCEACGGWLACGVGVYSSMQSS